MYPHPQNFVQDVKRAIDLTCYTYACGTAVVFAHEARSQAKARVCEEGLVHLCYLAEIRPAICGLVLRLYNAPPELESISSGNTDPSPPSEL